MIANALEAKQPRTEVDAITGATFHDLGVEFPKPQGLDLLHAPILTVATHDITSLAVVDRVVNPHQLYTLLGELKTNIESQGVYGTLDDWRNPQFKEQHRKLGPPGYWDMLLTNLQPFIDTLRLSSETDPEFFKAVLGVFAKGTGNEELNGYSSIKENISRLLFRGGHVEEFYFIQHRETAAKVYLSYSRFAWENDYSSQDTVREYFHHLGQTPADRAMRLIQISINGEPLTQRGRRKFYEQPVPQSVFLNNGSRGCTYSKIDNDLIEFGGFNTNSGLIHLGGDHKDLFYADGEAVPDRGLLPIVCFEIGEDGRRRFVHDMAQVEAQFPGVVESLPSSHRVLPSTLAGFLTLVYAQPEIRKLFPDRLPFRVGEREQAMLEAQIPFVAMMLERAFMNSQFANSLNEALAKAA